MFLSFSALTRSSSNSQIANRGQLLVLLYQLLHVIFKSKLTWLRQFAMGVPNAIQFSAHNFLTFVTMFVLETTFH